MMLIKVRSSEYWKQRLEKEEVKMRRYRNEKEKERKVHKLGTVREAHHVGRVLLFLLIFPPSNYALDELVRPRQLNPREFLIRKEHGSRR